MKAAPVPAGSPAAADGGAQAQRQIWRWTALAALLWLLAVAAGGHALSRRIVAAQVEGVADSTAHDAASTARVVDRVFAELASVSGMVARQDKVAALAARHAFSDPIDVARSSSERSANLRQDPDVDEVGQSLQQLAGDLHYGRIFVLNRSGMVLGASNWDAADSLVGDNFEDRGFFLDALAEGSGQQFEVAADASTPRFYMARRIDAAGQDDNHPGAVAIRYDLAELVPMLTGRHVSLITDPQGMVLVASRPEFLLRHVGALAREPIDRIRISETLRINDVQSLAVQAPARRLHAEHWRIDGAPYLVHDVPLDANGFRLVALSSLDFVAGMRSTHLAVGAVVALLGLLLVLVVGRAAAQMVRHRQEELELSESHAALLQIMIDRMPNAVFYQDAEGRVQGFNRVFETMFGVTHAQVVGKRAHELGEFLVRAGFSPERVGVVTRASDTPVHTEMDLRFADGRTHPVLYSASGFRMRDGAPGGTVGVIVDVAPLKAAEQALRASHHEQLAIFEAASMGIAILVEGSIVRCNHRLEEMFGYAEGGLRGQRMRVLFATEADYEAGRDAMRTGIRRDLKFRGDLLLQRKDGSAIWCRISGRYIDQAARETGSVWYLEDVTEENAAAEALREAKRLADEATQAKSMFLANMSHEIRTPMNAIIGLSHLALQTGLDARQRDYIAKVHGAGTALLGIVNDILDFSKIEAGKLEIESVPFRLRETLDSVLVLLGDRALEKGLALDLQAGTALPATLVGDPLRLGQVVTNLVSNAIKFTERGRVEVAVQAVAQDADALVLRMQVRDSGIGMTAEQAARLFQPFSQADGTTTRKYGGTGLGLTICKRLVEAMGGAIGVDSVPGQGSCFWFTVRLGLPSGEQEEQAGAAGGAGTAPAADLRGVRLLLAEDNEINQQIAVELLQGAGAAVEVAQNGAEAVQRLAAGERYDAVLMDLQMPVMDGLQATRLIRAAPHHAQLPIIAMTAHAMVEERERCLAAGMVDHITKPIDPPALFRTLARWVQPRAATATAPAPAAAPGAGQDAAALPAFPGLDSAAGLARVGGNQALYRRLLAQFADKQADAGPRVAQALAGGERETAERIAHTVRGVAGNIGLVAVQQAAAALEQAIRDGQPVQPALQALEAALGAAVAALRGALQAAAPAAAAAAPVAAADPAVLGRHAAALAQLLALSDSDAGDYYTAHRTVLRQALGDAPMAALEQALDDYEFEAALEHLRTASAAHGIAL